MDRGFRLYWIEEVLILSSGPVLFAGLALWLGQSLDPVVLGPLAYNGFAWETARFGFDAAPAGAASFANPLPAFALQVLGPAMSPQAMAALAGAIQGLGVSLLYAIARGLLSAETPWPRLAALAVAFLGALAPVFLSRVGAVFGPGLLAVPVLLSLALLLWVDRRMAGGEALLPLGLTALAGLVSGLTIGLEPAFLPYALGLLAAVFSGHAWLFRRAGQAVALVTSGTLGFVLTFGPWTALLAGLAGRDGLPPYDEILAAAYAGGGAPLPVLSEPRLAALLALLPLAILILAAGMGAALRFTKPAGTRQIFAFCAATALGALAGLPFDPVVLVLLGPLVALAAIGLLPASEGARWAAVAASCAALAAFTAPDRGPRAAFAAGQEAPVPLPVGETAMVLLAGSWPTAQVVASAPAGVPFLRIDGPLADPRRLPDHAWRLRGRIERQLAFGGPLFLLAAENEVAASEPVLARFGAALGGSCVRADAPLGPGLSLCGLKAIAP
jgi:hypothetical protein